MSGDGSDVRLNRSRRGWGRLAAGLAACLAGGIAISAVVAAVCLLYMPINRAIVSTGGVSSGDAAGRELGTVGFNPGQVYAGLGCRENMDYWFWVLPTPQPGWAPVVGAGVQSIQCGWPCLAFATPPHEFPPRCEDVPQWNTVVQTAYARRTTSNLPVFLKAHPYRGLPTRPLWLGLAVNTLLFGGLLAVFFLAVPVARRALRRRAGRCESCGYPVRGLERCPECGTRPEYLSPFRMGALKAAGGRELEAAV